MPKSNSLVVGSGDRWTITQARSMLSALDASGLTPYAFARSRGVDPQRLYYWRRRIEEGEAAPAFVEVHRPAPVAVEIVALSGRVLRVTDAIDGTTLRRLVAALEDDELC